MEVLVDKAMQSLDEFMPRAVAEILSRAPLTPEKIAFAWRVAVGAAVAKVTTVALEGHVLRVRARDAAWGREVERSAPIIRTRLDTLLGSGVVRDVRVTAAQADESGNARRRR